MDKAIVGVDVGGTNTVIGVFDESLSLLLKHSIPTLKPYFPNKTNNPKLFLDVLSEAIQKLVHEAGYEGRLACVGMGVPGKVDPVRGMALCASNLGWSSVPFAEEMSWRLSVPVYIDNDVRIYTLGEAWAGAGRGYRNLVCLTLGTGLAAGIIIDGKLIRGSDWYAGEIGHDTVQGESFPCNCGKRGCLETIASANGIARLAEEAVGSGQETLMRNIPHKLTSLEVYEACVHGDHAAIEIYRHVGRTLGYKLATVTFLLNPEMIIIGGGVASAGEFLLAPIRSIIDEQYATQKKKPIIRTGELGDTAGLIGAVRFALDHNHL